MPQVIYRSTDPSAPTLTGEVGSLIGVLDACLVNGYGSRAAAGWTKPYLGINEAAYRMGAGAQFYMRIRDNALDVGGAREARIHGYESMTDVSTGTNPFPSTATVSIVRKSSTLDTTVRSWVVVADERTVYIFVVTGDYTTLHYGYGFGEFTTYSSVADNYNVFVSSRHTVNAANRSMGLDVYDAPNWLGTVTTNGFYLARTGDGVTLSPQGGLLKPKLGGSTSQMFDFPNGADGSVYHFKWYVTESLAATGLRGEMRGIHTLANSDVGALNGATFAGSGDYVGKSFEILKPAGSELTHAYAIETTAWG